MCTEDQHKEKIELLKQLVGNPPIDHTYQLSATQPYILDYQERRYVYLWSTNDLTLSLEELGSLAISAGSWVNLSLSPGMRIFAVGQSTLVPIFVRCSDEQIDPGQPPINIPLASTATLTSVASSASAVQLVAANTNRKALYLQNDSTQILYLAYATVALTSTANYTVQIPAQGFWEMPPSPVYTGLITGIWAGANGNARITEVS